MANKTIVIIALTLVAGMFAYVFMQSQNAPLSHDDAAQEEEAAVRNAVDEFGRKLQMVSLLAPAAERKAAMDAAYGSHVAPELLAMWYPEGAEALGRSTSSPWPDRIDVVEVRQTDGNFVVEGNVIEVAQSEEGIAPAAVYPLTLALEKRNGKWLIVKADKGAYSTMPQRQSIVGYWECLPPKNTDGPHTLECAYGIAVDQSDGHYAVDTHLMSTHPVDFPTGTKVRVSGIVTPANQLSSVQKYDIDGIISATTIEKI